MVQVGGRRAAGAGSAVELLLQADGDTVRVVPAVPVAVPAVARVS
jgi:hypothetical protein